MSDVQSSFAEYASMQGTLQSSNAKPICRGQPAIASLKSDEETSHRIVRGVSRSATTSGRGLTRIAATERNIGCSLHVAAA